jgi:hypothetical protein
MLTAQKTLDRADDLGLSFLLTLLLGKRERSAGSDQDLVERLPEKRQDNPVFSQVNPQVGLKKAHPVHLQQVEEILPAI